MFKEDLSAFLNVDEHADKIVIRKNGDIIDAIVEKEFVDTLEIQGFRPVITGRTVDLDCLQKGDFLERNDEVYKFIHPEADGTGMTRAILEYVEG